MKELNVFIDESDEFMTEIGKIPKLKSISVDEERTFQYILEVMNGCFGKNFRKKSSCQVYTFGKIDDSHTVWFPQIAVKKNGTYKSQRGKDKWLNILLDDGETIIEEKENDSRSGKADGDGGLPRYTFGKIKDKGYVFLGVFIADKERCKKGHWEFKRIETRIDLRKYHRNILRQAVMEINEVADNDLISNLRYSILSKKDDGFQYKGKPRGVKEPVIRDDVAVYPRDRQTAINALAHAHFMCEIDKNHPTFIRKHSEKAYTEPHHLIPLAFQSQFSVSLDVEENIVSLCSNCHNEIHYGRNADILIRKLYAERKEDLIKTGIELTLDVILSMYEYRC